MSNNTHNEDDLDEMDEAEEISEDENTEDLESRSTALKKGVKKMRKQKGKDGKLPKAKKKRGSFRTPDHKMTEEEQKKNLTYGDLFRRAVGRPKAYDTKEQLQEAIQEYFDSCNNVFVLPSKAGLISWLGISRDTYNTYRKKPEFSDTIKIADSLVERAWVQRLSGQAATGAIFYLKNAFKETYKDRYETDHTSKGEKIEGFTYVDPTKK